MLGGADGAGARPDAEGAGRGGAVAVVFGSRRVVSGRTRADAGGAGGGVQPPSVTVTRPAPAQRRAAPRIERAACVMHPGCGIDRVMSRARSADERARSWWRWSGVLLGWGLASCGHPDAVRLGGSVDSLELAVEQRALGTFLTGGFTLRLALGGYADDPVTVSGVTFALTRAASGAELGLGPLDVRSTGVALPLEVDPGDEVTLAYDLVAEDPLATDAAGRLCEEPLVLRATVQHSLGGGATTTARSPAVTPAGCD